MNYGKKFAVKPGAKVRLAKIDPSFTGKHETHAEALSEIQAHVERMGKLQYLLYADGRQSLTHGICPSCLAVEMRRGDRERRLGAHGAESDAA